MGRLLIDLFCESDYKKKFVSQDNKVQVDSHSSITLWVLRHVSTVLRTC
jgi:hypothetical protein